MTTNSLTLVPNGLLAPVNQLSGEQVESVVAPLRSTMRQIMDELEALFPHDEDAGPRFEGYELSESLEQKIVAFLGLFSMSIPMNFEELSEVRHKLAPRVLDSLLRSQYHYVLSDVRGSKKLCADVDEFCRDLGRYERQYGIELREFKRAARAALDALRKYLNEHTNFVEVNLVELGRLYNAEWESPLGFWLIMYTAWRLRANQEAFTRFSQIARLDNERELAEEALDALVLQGLYSLQLRAQALATGIIGK